MAEDESPVPILEADAYHIGMELYDKESIRDLELDDFDLGSARFRIEMHEVKPLFPRVNLHRISDAIAVKYRLLPSYEAVIEFLEEFYEQCLEREDYGQARVPANTLCAMYIDDCYWGHNIDETDDDGHYITTRPTLSDETLREAVEWHIWAILAEHEWLGRFMGSDSDRVAELFSSRSGRDVTDWYDLMLEVSREIGPDTEGIIGEYVGKFEKPRSEDNPWNDSK